MSGIVHAAEVEKLLLTGETATVFTVYWRPIETAPRNGTAILLALPKPLHSNDVEGYVPWSEIGTVIGWWDDSCGVNERVGHWEISFMFEGSGDSNGYTSHFFIELAADHPTHWMPLPVTTGP